MPLKKLFRFRIVLPLLLAGIICLGGLLVWAISFPSVQTWLVKRSETILETVLSAEVELDAVSLALPANGKLEGISILSEDGSFEGGIESINLSLLDFSLWDYVLNNRPLHTLSLNEVTISGVSLPLVKDSTGRLNLMSLIGSSSGQKKTSQRLLKFEIEDLRLVNCSFSYTDSLRLPPDSLRGQVFQATEMKIDSINLDASFSLGPGKRFEADIHQLSAQETMSGLTLNDLSFTILSDTIHSRDRRGWKEVVPYVSLNGIDLIEGQTELHVDIRYPRTELMDLLRGDLLYRYFEADWKNSRLHTNSIQKFSPTLLPIKGLLRIDGRTLGTINDLYSPGLFVSMGSKTHLKAKFRINDLLNYKETQLDVRFEEAFLNTKELRAFLPGLEIPYLLDTVTLANASGRYSGAYTDFQILTKGELGKGKAQVDLHLTLPPTSTTLRYAGSVGTTNLNPNSLGFNSLIDSRLLNAKVVVDGKGTSIASLASTLNLTVWNSDLYSYRVDSILATLDVRQKRISGNAKAHHDGGFADLLVDMNLAASPSVYDIRGGVKTIDLHKYGLWEEPLVVSTRFIADFIGDSLEQVEGLFRLAESSVTNKEGNAFNLYQSKLEVSRNSEGDKLFQLQSPVSDIDLKGNFTLKRLGGLVGMLATESKIYFSNDDSLIQDYYLTKEIDSLETSGELALKTNQELNRLLTFLQIPVKISPQSTLNTNFTFGFTEILSLSLQSDSIKYSGISFEGVSGTAEVYKQSSDNVLALLAGLNAEKMDLGDGHEVDRVAWEIDGADDNFNGLLRLQQYEENNYVQILSQTIFKEDGSIYSEINPERTYLIVNGDSLELMDGNSVNFHNGIFDIQNIILQSEETYFRLDGLISKDPQDVLTLSVGQFPISILADFTEFSYVPAGTFNLEARMQQLLTDPCLNIVSRLEDFTLDDYEYGEIYTEGHWQAKSGHLQLDASLFDGVDTTLHVVGYYALSDSIAPLHFTLGTEHGFPFDYVYPFVKAQLYELEGQVDLDQFTITGSLGNPVILGTGHFTDAGFGVDYFKTKYKFDGSIQFENDKIVFPRIRLYDVNKNYAQLYGFIYHVGLDDIRFDLQVEEANNFLLMNTRKGDNELFYGRLLLKDGLGSVTGDLEKLSLDMFATSGRGSFLKIPLEDTGAEDRPDFIHFSGEEKNDDTYETGLKDFEINLSIGMTEDLEVDLIFDEKVGDIIRGKGVGNLSMYINEAGEFTMFGDYEITEGNYLFTAQNILNKKFLVKPGGTIVWTGDPYDAQLKLDAYYPLYADISQLLQEEQTIRTPVNVNMGMNGSLLEPEIALSIELPSLTEGDASQIASYLKSIRYDEQELNKQVFSLMVFNRFAPVGGFLGDNAASSGVTTSISELISNQLNYWLGQAIGENVNVGVGTNNFQDVNLLLSASLFNDRVTIERDGTLIDDNSNLSIGNVSVQIKLLPAIGNVQVTDYRPSELILEVFTRESLDANLNNNTYQAGIGIFYKKDFDQIKDLFQRGKKKK